MRVIIVTTTILLVASRLSAAPVPDVTTGTPRVPHRNDLPSNFHEDGDGLLTSGVNDSRTVVASAHSPLISIISDGESPAQTASLKARMLEGALDEALEDMAHFTRHSTAQEAIGGSSNTAPTALRQPDDGSSLTLQPKESVAATRQGNRHTDKMVSI